MKHNFSKSYFFRSLVIKWNDFDSNIRKSVNISAFKNNVVNFLQPAENRIFDWHNPKGIKSLTRMRLAFGHLSDRKFERGFQDSFNSFCSCDYDTETNSYILHCPQYFNEKMTRLDKTRDTEDISK